MYFLYELLFFRIGCQRWPYLQVPVNCLGVTWKLYNLYCHNVHYYVLLLSIDSVNVAEMMECFSCQDLDPRLLGSSLSSLSCIEKSKIGSKSFRNQTVTLISNICIIYLGSNQHHKVSWTLNYVYLMSLDFFIKG